MPDLDLIYVTARGLPPAERPSYLVKACQGDDALRRRVEQMLAVADKAEAFITDLPDAEAEDPKPGHESGPPNERQVPNQPDEVVGQRIGRYKILERVGEGGCGVVYVAEQTDPMRRRVALKVIKLGMDTKQVVARFEAERQALALMDHPNIARVLDAGTTETGRPYFVMELVRGIKLTDYCDQNNLPTRERLDLFMNVCQAIQHAHQKGIIHRDIKPSNILVTLHDGVPVPKVIDFGIAKATEGRLTDATVYTQLHQFIGTPAYMSPEQAEMSGLDIDTRSDIYSLGVLLYELLAGSTPFDAKELMASGLDAMRKTIREKEPVRPSTKLAALKREELTTTAKCRASDPPKLIHLLKGDLDWIVMKCLEKDRQRRYDTANGLVTDIKRYLNHEAVAARPPSAAYRFQKSFRRNKLVFLAGAAVALALLVGTGVSTWQAARATRAEQRARQNEATAQQEAARANQQKRLAEDNLAKAEKAEQDATEQRKRADHEAENARQKLYYSQMHLGLQAWREHSGLRQMRQLLANWLPQGEPVDRRGWEWFYLNSLPYQNLRTFTESRTSKGPCTVAWHAASNRVAEGTADGLIRIWDPDREETTLILRAPAPWIPYWGGRWLAWNRTGDQLAAGSKDGSVHVWETVAGREIKVLREQTSGVLFVAYSSEGTHLASWGTNGTIKIWDATTGQLTAAISHPGNVTAGAWSPNDKLLASGHEDGTVTISGAQTGAEIVTLRAHVDTVYHLAWSPDSARIATTSANDFFVNIWEVASQTKVLGPLRHSHGITAMAWAQDGRGLATGSMDQTAKIWDTTTGRETVTLRGHVQNVSSLSWGPDGRLASGSSDGSMRIWDSVRDQESKVLPEQGVRTTSVSWSPDGKRLASGSDDGKVRIWNPATRKVVLSLKAHNEHHFFPQFGLIRALAWNPNARQLASAGVDGTAKVWDVASGREEFALPVEHGSVWSVAWSADGTQLAAGSQDGTVRIVEGLPQAPTVRHFPAHKGHLHNDDRRAGVRALAWSPQGNHLASTGWDSLVKLWDPVNGTELVRMQGHRGWVMGVTWSPDGKRLASGATDNLLMIWDAETGRKIETMRGHTTWIEAVGWSPNGTRLASAGIDNSVRIWDPRTGEETFALRGDAGMFHAVSWHPTGMQLAAASSDGQIWIWDATRGFEQDTTQKALP